MKEEEEEVSVLSINGCHALLPESTLVVSFEWAVVQTQLMDDVECAVGLERSAEGCTWL